MSISTYKDLRVWQHSIKLVVAIYILTREFPSEEKYGLTSQLRRASVSSAANIAEGHGRASRRDYARFVSMAIGSAREVETLLLISINVGCSARESTVDSEELVDAVSRMLCKLHASLAQTG